MNPLPTIRQKVIEAVPEIMELKFGCVVLNEVGIEERVLWSQESWKKGGKDVQLEGTAVAIHESELKEIIGRPIRLADVLAAIRATGDPAKYYSGITCLGNFTEYFNERTVWRDENKRPISWNLLKDDLDHQSPETLSFLYELLK